MKSLVVLVSAFTLAATVAATPSSARAQPAPPPSLDVEQQALIDRGEYSAGEIVAGGLVGTFVGFGGGHAVQGRWGERGWIFTVGEAGSIAAIIGGAAMCVDSAGSGAGCVGLTLGGVLGVLGFHTWEVIDVWAAPLAHNARVKRARQRAGRWSAYVAPTGRRSGLAGLSLSF